MHALRELLQSCVKQHRLEPELEKARLPRYWQDVVGEALAARTVLRSFDQGVLRVHVPEAPWRSELVIRREELRLKINACAGGELVREIIIR
jgi:predicted nucleic acid-binding Zn ribbon protein